MVPSSLTFDSLTRKARPQFLVTEESAGSAMLQATSWSTIRGGQLGEVMISSDGGS